VTLETEQNSHVNFIAFKNSDLEQDTPILLVLHFKANGNQKAAMYFENVTRI